MKIVKSLITGRPALAYFVLAFAISWGAVLIVAGGVPVSEDQLALLGVAMLLGPSIAGLALTGLVYGRSGFRDLRTRFFKWRVNARWYAVALLTAPLSMAAVLLTLSLFSSDFVPAIVNADKKLVLLLSGIAAGLTVGIFEEIGWTGFAVPRLRERYSVLFAGGIIVGLAWGAWHFIVFWESDSFSSVIPFALLLARLFSFLPFYRVLMVWVYERTESLFVVILMHASLVASLVIIEPPLTDPDLLIYILARAVVWGVIATVVMVNWQAPRYNRYLALKEKTL